MLLYNLGGVVVAFYVVTKCLDVKMCHLTWRENIELIHT